MSAAVQLLFFILSPQIRISKGSSQAKNWKPTGNVPEFHGKGGQRAGKENPLESGQGKGDSSSLCPHHVLGAVCQVLSW